MRANVTLCTVGACDKTKVFQTFDLFFHAVMTDTTMLIKKVQPAEADLLLAFAERTFRTAYEHLNDPFFFKQYCDTTFLPERFKMEMEHPQSGFWFGWIDGQLAAYLKLNFDQHPAELDSQRTVQVERLYVEPSLQGRRLGEKMLDFAYEQARSTESEWLWLSVWKANPPALRFYERCGYEIFGTEIFQVGDDPQEDWLMKKRVIGIPGFKCF